MEPLTLAEIERRYGERMLLALCALLLLAGLAVTNARAILEPLTEEPSAFMAAPLGGSPVPGAPVEIRFAPRTLGVVADAVPSRGRLLGAPADVPLPSDFGDAAVGPAPTAYDAPLSLAATGAPELPVERFAFADRTGPSFPPQPILTVFGPPETIQTPDDTDVTEQPTPAVPEPATWMTLIVGFAFMGSALRGASRRRRGEAVRS